MQEPALFIEVTRRCNNKCKYCGAWRHKGIKENEWTKEQYIKLFKIIKKLNYPRINFTGGEPTLRNDIREIVAEAIKEVDAEIHFTTNGSLVTAQTSLWELPISLIKININTIDPEVYSKITGSNYLCKVIEGIDYLTEKNKKVRLHSVIFQESIHTILNLIHFCDQRNIDLKLFQIDTDLSSTDKQPVDLYEIEKYLKNTSVYDTQTTSPGLPIQVYYRDGGNEIHLVKSNLPRFNSILCEGCECFPCDYGLYSVSIDPKGYAYPCLIQPNRMKMKLDLEDVQKSCEILQKMSDLIKGGVLKCQ